MENELIYDCVYNRVGILRVGILNNYVLMIEDQNLYFKEHPVDWGNDSDEDHGTVQSMGTFNFKDDDERISS